MIILIMKTNCSETNNLSDPVEKAQKENVINNEMIVSVDESIQDAKGSVSFRRRSRQESTTGG